MHILIKPKTKFKLTFTGGIALFLLAVAGLAVQTPKAYALCDNVNIVHCGLSGSGAKGYIDSLQHYWNTSKDDAGHTDIRKIMQWGGWTSGMVSGANTGNTKVGTLNSKTGKITVDGRVVATDTYMTARFTEGSGFTQVAPGVWKRLITRSHAQDSYTVLMHFGANGRVDAGVAVDCGNVITFTPTPPPAAVAKCTGLDEPKLINRDSLIYSFTAQAKAENAKLISGKFDYGDGAKQSGTVKGTTLVGKHQYKKGGKYTIVATLKFSAYDKTETDTCQTKLTITVPFYSCVQLGGEILDKDTFSYRYVATMKYGNGAEFVSANFDFGDGNTVTGVKSSDGKTVTADHTYAQAGEYHAFATLQFNVNGKTVTAPACRAFVTPTTPPTPECKPGIPVGDIRCNPCEYDASITADDEDCIAPEATELPNTGAGNVIALSSLALVGGFLWYRHVLFKRHKAAYVAAEADVSPLPLAEPLETDTPLAGTPLAQQKKRPSLRRNRRY